MYAMTVDFEEKFFDDLAKTIESIRKEQRKQGQALDANTFMTTALRDDVKTLAGSLDKHNERVNELDDKVSKLTDRRTTLPNIDNRVLFLLAVAIVFALTLLAATLKVDLPKIPGV